MIVRCNHKLHFPPDILRGIMELIKGKLCIQVTLTKNVISQMHRFSCVPIISQIRIFLILVVIIQIYWIYTRKHIFGKTNLTFPSLMKDENISLPKICLGITISFLVLLTFTSNDKRSQVLSAFRLNTCVLCEKWILWSKRSWLLNECFL